MFNEYKSGPTKKSSPIQQNCQTSITTSRQAISRQVNSIDRANHSNTPQIYSDNNSFTSSTSKMDKGSVSNRSSGASLTRTTRNNPIIPTTNTANTSYQCNSSETVRSILHDNSKREPSSIASVAFSDSQLSTYSSAMKYRNYDLEEREFQQVKRENEEYKKYNTKLKEELIECEQEREKDKEFFFEKVKEYERNQEKLQERIGQLERELSFTKTEDNLKSSNHQVYINKIRNLQDEISSYVKENNGLQHKLIEEANKRNDLEKKFNDDHSEVRGLSKQVKKLEKAIDVKDEQIKLLEEKLLEREQSKYDTKIKTGAVNLSRKEVSEKENFMQIQDALERKIQDLNGQLLVLRTQNNPNLIVNDFSNFGPSQLKNIYASLKTSLRSLVTNIADNLRENNLLFSEDDEVDMEYEFSIYTFRDQKKMIIETVLTSIKVDEDNVREIGNILEKNKNLKQNIVKKATDTLSKHIQEKFKSVRGKWILFEKLVYQFFANILEFYIKLFNLEKQMDLVWYDENSYYNPFEHTSQNLTEQICIKKVLFPCLMIQYNKSVFETALVVTKKMKIK